MSDATQHKEPYVEPRPVRREVQGIRLEDPFAWLADRQNPEVLAYLEAENAWADAAMSAQSALRDELYRELVGRIQEDDETVPVAIDDWLYYERTRKGEQFPIHCRRRVDGDEAVLLDPNVLGLPFVVVGAFEVSVDHRFLAYSLDSQGAERFLLKVRDLATMEDLGEEIPNTSPTVAWSNDGSYLFYVEIDAVSRPFRVRRHRMGTTRDQDVTILEESDERFFVSLSHCRSRGFLRISLDSHTTSELWVIPADQPELPPRRLVGRQQDVELRVDHHGDYFYLLTNDQALNFRLMRAAVAAAGEFQWEEIVPHDPEVELLEVDLFASHLVLSYRSRGLRGLRVYELPSFTYHEVAFDEAVYTVKLEQNEMFATEWLRWTYSSPLTPPSVFDYHLASHERVLRKRTAVLGTFRPELYRTERLFAVAEDGAEIPVSLVYRRDLELHGRNPTLLTGYGSYGVSTEPRFSSARWSLLERGFVFAIAHVRGGGECGRGWYHAGKLEHKTRTFSDFEAVAETLVALRYTSPRHLAIRGGSAGGMLIGAVLNRRPELFHAALAEVPFVDVVNTMLDPNLPLTVIEYEEWGNPAVPGVLERLLGYSPYDNVRPQAYPHLLVTGGFNDSRVMYWEPAKWVAKLRARRQDANLLLMRIDLGVGHGGAAGRYDALREEAWKFAFLLHALERPRCDHR